MIESKPYFDQQNKDGPPKEDGPEPLPEVVVKEKEDKNPKPKPAEAASKQKESNVKKQASRITKLLGQGLKQQIQAMKDNEEEMTFRHD